MSLREKIGKAMFVVGVTGIPLSVGSAWTNTAHTYRLENPQYRTENRINEDAMLGLKHEYEKFMIIDSGILVGSVALALTGEFIRRRYFLDGENELRR